MTASQRAPARFVLGTAQIGMPYGAANRSGMLSERDAVALIAAALAGGLHIFDTARAYGDSERRLGRALANISGVTIVTKLDPLVQLQPDADSESVRAATRQSLGDSRLALAGRPLDVVLLHRAAHLTNWGGAVWRLLQDEQANGRIGSIGVSIQSPAEAHEVLTDPAVRHVQLPFNLLDWRWRETGVIAALRARPDICVHVRSAFLQGLLVNDHARWPSGLPAGEIAEALTQLTRETGRASRADLCIAFLRAQDWIDGIVVGCETTEQLDDNLRLFDRAPLNPPAADAIVHALPRASETLLDPARWS